MIVVNLIYFHQIKGPLLFYSYPEGLLDDILSVKLATLLDTANEGFFTYSFKNMNSLNYYFTIYSEWAHSKKEHLMLSLILDTKTPKIEEGILNLCKEFSEYLNSKKEVYTAFYINDMKFKHSRFSYKENIKTEIAKNKELIIKNDVIIKKKVNNLFFSVVERLF